MYILETQYDELQHARVQITTDVMYTFAFAHDLKNMNVTTNLKRKEI